MPDWLWTETAAARASTGVGVAAVYFALQSWRASVLAVRSSYRPLLRPVVAAHNRRHGSTVVLKNYGAGPALSIVILVAPDGAWVGTANVIEPLGQRDGNDDASRVGVTNSICRGR